MSYNAKDHIFGMKDHIFGMKDHIFGMKDHIFGMKDHIFGMNVAKLMLKGLFYGQKQDVSWPKRAKNIGSSQFCDSSWCEVAQIWDERSQIWDGDIYLECNYSIK
jgi:hypothetical protein